MLPLLVGDLVPEDDPHWLNFLLLLSIIDIMAPKATKALAAYLRELNLQHHTAFKELYPERPITPKMHYIIHIPQDDKVNRHAPQKLISKKLIKTNY